MIAKTQSFALILSFCCLSPEPVRAQQAASKPGEVRILTSANVPTLSDREKKQLKSKLRGTDERGVKTFDADNAPLAIDEARARGLKVEGNYDASARASAPMNDYVMQLSAKLVNRVSRSITGFGIGFANPQSKSLFYVYRHALEIGVGKKYGLDIGFMAVSGDPAELNICLVGVLFADGTVWGSFPFPPNNPPSQLSQAQSTSQVAPSPLPPTNTPPALPQAPSTSEVAPRSPVPRAVDSKPILLNSPQPRYTEDARKNGVLGVALVRVLVDTDGSVTRAKVIRPLPDGLTEEALRAVYSLKFKPARRDDQPVPFWQNVVIEFNLK